MNRTTEKPSDSPTGNSESSSPVAPSKSTPFFPLWVTKNLKSKYSWKVLIRCCFAGWVSFVLILPNASLNVLGSAGFFVVLASLFLPPSFPVQLFIFLVSTVVLGLLLGWGIGAAGMRSALAVRDMSLVQGTYAQLQNTTAFQSNPTFATTVAIFDGEFLDILSTVLYGIFLAIGTFLFSLSRAYAPKLMFFSIFGMIGVDVFATIGPLLPTARYTLLNSFLISVGCYAGVGLLATVLVFPETMNHASMNAISELFDQVKDLLVIQDEVLKKIPTEELKEKIRGMRMELLGGIQQLTATSAFLPLEFSWGKWNSDDVKELQEPLKGLVARIAALQSFASIVSNSEAVPSANSNSSTTSLSTTSTSSSAKDTFLLNQLLTQNRAREDRFNVRISDMLPILDSCTVELRNTCTQGIIAVQAYLDRVNRHRWRPHKNLDAVLLGDLDKAVEDLKTALEEFKAEKRLDLLVPFASLEKEEGGQKEKEQLPLRALYVSYVFASNLISTAESVLVLAGFAQTTAAKRVRNRLWAPKGLRKIGKAFMQRGDERDGVLGEDTTPAKEAMRGEEGGDEEEQSYRRDPDSRPPTNAFQKTMNIVHAFYRWTKTPEALFCFKTVFVSIALWLPAVIHRSAFFYYKEKGLWALIMAQTTINIYVADQIFNLVVRLIGTFIGLLFGLLTWYIGAGSGNGSPYGEAAIVGVMFFPMMFVRLYCPPHLLPAVVLMAVTWTLIVGYSWVDGHLNTYGSPGIGWSVAWRRWVLVVIGSAASFIMMMLPPTSGRKAVRRRNASSISSLSRTYSFLISAWIDPSLDTKKGEEWKMVFREKIVGAAEEIRAIRQLTDVARWEGGVRGKWPYTEYMRLADVQGEMLGSLAQLGSALSNLDDEWRVGFTHVTKVLNPHFIADVMAIFTLVSQSLLNGEPMHQVLPGTLLERLFYHHHGRHHEVKLEEGKKKAEDLRSLDYMYYATGIVAVFQLLRSLDELHAITKELCGEVPLRGFIDWREDYNQSHLQTRPVVVVSES